MSAEPSRKHRWLVWLGVAAVALIAAAAIGAVWLDRYMSHGLRDRAEAILGERLQSKVALADLQVTVGRRIALKGTGLVIRHHGRTDVPPLISIEAFEAEVPWSGYFEKPPRLSRVHVRGLRITMPPKDDPVRDHEAGGCQNREADEPRAVFTPEPAPFVIDRLTSEEAILTLLPRRAGKRPREFAIAKVELHAFALDRPAPFEATLTNPVPRGDIAANGTFGPWNPSNPGGTAVKGAYRFSNADLGTIKGIAGQLESTGDFDGLLQEIIVTGETRVADFGLTTSQNRLPLKTTFAACVDGTDGDTYLDKVEAQLANTHIAASGKVEGKVGVHGRLIALDVKVADGHIDDLLRLAVNDTTPLMTGRIDVDSGFSLPPGEADVIERLALQGRFSLRNARFTEGGVQTRINELSRRGRGDMDEAKASPVRAAFGGRFALDHSVLRLSSFRFAVPGAVVQLQGQYGLKTETIDFRGQVRTEARVSAMTTGYKSVLLKVMDPLFARDGAGAVFPITISGTREAPKMGVDVKKALLRKD